MFSMIMPKSGFRLRPLEMRDQTVLETHLCADPEIAKTLAHDASSAEICRKSKSDLLHTGGYRMDGIPWRQARNSSARCAVSFSEQEAPMVRAIASSL